jgi:hypothetical protein
MDESAATFVVQTITELVVVADVACTFVMSTLDGVGGGVVLLALLTKPEQPLNITDKHATRKSTRG